MRASRALSVVHGDKQLMALKLLLEPVLSYSGAGLGLSWAILDCLRPSWDPTWAILLPGQGLEDLLGRHLGLSWAPGSAMGATGATPPGRRTYIYTKTYVLSMIFMMRRYSAMRPTMGPNTVPRLPKISQKLLQDRLRYSACPPTPVWGHQACEITPL